jgi:hypothetical protein
MDGGEGGVPGRSGAPSGGSSGVSDGGGEGGNAGSIDESVQIVHVYDLLDLHSVVDALVVVNDSGGRLVSTSRSGRRGTVEARIPLGGSVSAIHVRRFTVDGEARTYRSIGTVFDVQPTFDLIEVRVVDPPAAIVTPQAKAPMTVTATFPDVGSRKSVALSCAGERSITGLTFVNPAYQGCADRSAFDMWVLAFNAAGDPIGYGKMLGIPFRPGGMSSHTLEITAAATSTVRLLATEIPPASELLNFHVGAYESQESFDAGNGAHSFRSSIAMPSEEGRILLNFPAGAFSYFQYRAVLSVTSAPFEISAEVVRSTGTVGFPDWSLQDVALFEPRLGLNTVDAGRPELSWALVPDGGLGDSVDVYLSWGLEQYPNSVFWWSSSPPTASSVQLPTLPDEVADLRPVEGETMDFMVWHRDLADPEGYAEFVAAKVQNFSPNEATASIRPGADRP